MGTTILLDSVIARKCNKLWMKIRGHGKDRKMNGPSSCGCSPLFLFSQDQCVRVLLNPTKANHQSPPGIVWRGRWVKHWMNILKGGTAFSLRSVHGVNYPRRKSKQAQSTRPYLMAASFSQPQFLVLSLNPPYCTGARRPLCQGRDFCLVVIYISPSFGLRSTRPVRWQGVNIVSCPLLRTQQDDEHWKQNKTTEKQNYKKVLL